MRKGLRKVSKGFAAMPGFFGIQTEMVGVGEHLFEHQPRVVQEGVIKSAGSGQRLDQPERAHIEGALVATQTVGCLGRIVTMDQARGRFESEIAPTASCSSISTVS